MKRYAKFLSTALVLASVSLAPAWAGDAGDDDEDKMLSEVAPSGSDPDREIAREKLCTHIIHIILRDLSFDAVKPNKRKAIIAQVGAHLREESWRPTVAAKPNGTFILRAKWSRSEIDNLVQQALNFSDIFGQKVSVIYIMPSGWNGSGLAQNDVIMNAIRVNLNDYLLSHGFRVAPGALDKQKAEKAAAASKVSPSVANLSEYAEAFGADWTIFAKGQIQYFVFRDADGNPHPIDNMTGDLRTQDCSVQVIDRAHGENLMEFRLPSTDTKTEQGEATATMLHQPRIPDVGSKEKVAEEYASFIGKMMGANIARRLFSKWFRDQPDDPPGGAATPPSGNPPAAMGGKCSCGQDLDPNATVCPACGAKVVKPAAPPAQPANNFRKPRHPDDDYVLQINNFQETEVNAIFDKMTTLGEHGFGNWVQSNESSGKFSVYKFTFVGEFVIKKVRDALGEIGYDDSKVSVSKSGQNIVIKKK